jgi:hypothetical protein
MSLRSRRRKLAIFRDLMGPRPGICILNIGATPPHVWEALTGKHGSESGEQPELDPAWEPFRIVGLNLHYSNTKAYADFHQGADRIGVTADACFSHSKIKVSTLCIQMPSSSMCHALSTKRWQEKSCASGGHGSLRHRIFGIQWSASPAALFQFLPTRTQRAIQLKFRTWPDYETISLLSASRLQALFPTSQIIKVRVTFWPETLIACGHES